MMIYVEGQIDAGVRGEGRATNIYTLLYFHNIFIYFYITNQRSRENILKIHLFIYSNKENTCALSLFKLLILREFLLQKHLIHNLDTFDFFSKEICNAQGYHICVIKTYTTMFTSKCFFELFKTVFHVHFNGTFQ